MAPHVPERTSHPARQLLPGHAAGREASSSRLPGRCAALFLLCLSLLAHEDAAAFETRPAGVVGGLDVDVVTTVYQDRAGLLWIGTREGLFLHDGYGFTRFDHDPSDPASISDNTVRTMFEDSRGDLWIGTNTAGLNRLDRARWSFEHFRHDSSDPHSLSHDSVYAITEDDEGYLWVGTQIGLNRLDPGERRFERFVASETSEEGLREDYVTSLVADEAGSVWVATYGGGLYRLDPSTGKFERYGADERDPDSLASDFVTALAQGPDGDLWVGSGSGIQRFVPSTGRSAPLVPGAGASDHLPDPLVSTLVYGDGEGLWIGTWGGGLAHFAPETGRIETSRETSGGGGDATRIVSLALDSTGTLWLGTWGAGLRRLHSARGTFGFIERGADGSGIRNNDVRAVLEDRAGRLWIGTYGGGLQRRDPGADSFRVYRANGVANSVLALAEDDSGGIWSATTQDLIRLDPETGRIESWRHDDRDPGSLGPGYIVAVHVDDSGRVWAGTGEGGLHLLKPDRSGFTRFAHDREDAGSLSDDYVTAIHKDRAGRLWVGTRSGGLNLLRSGSGTPFERFLPDPDDDTSLSHHLVTSIFEDSGGTIWIGTEGGGLNRVLERAEDGSIGFAHVTERDGLIDDNVMGIAEAEDGSLWLSTRHGISRFDPDQSRFVNYDRSDGLRSINFNATSYTGEAAAYFGSTGGLVRVDRNAPFPEPRPSPTLLTSISSSSAPILGTEPVWQMEEVRVDYGEILAIEFAVLDYDEMRRHRYSYRMGPRHEEWIDLGQRRQLTFTDLEPGVHTLEVRGRNRQGIWSQAPAALRIEVVPPFWMAGWFRGVLLLALVATLVTGHRLRTAALRRRNRILVRLKDEREQALRSSDESRAALQATYDQLRRLNRRLEAAKEDERRRIARELHDEMGQALTAAKINLQLLGSVTDPARRERRTADTVALVDRMIGHVRELSLDLRPPMLDELGLVAALRGYLEAQARRTRLKIDFVTSLSGKELIADAEITSFRVVQESVTNAIRHAGASRINVELDSDDSGLKLSISDNGAGFDVATAMRSAAEGGHLGLLGIRERVETLGGTVEIDSRPGEGTTIRARIPLDEGRSLARTAG